MSPPSWPKPPLDGRRQHALVRRPGPLLAEGPVTHIERTPINERLALRRMGAVELRLHHMHVSGTVGLAE